jgi:S1-C subfamily serine protease
MRPGISAARGGAVCYVALTLLLGTQLQGCAPQNAANPTGPITNMTFKVNGNPTDEAGMLAARKSVIDKQIAGLATEADPIKGDALIVLPDHDRLRPLVAQRQSLALKRPVTGQALESMIDEEQQGLRELADAIIKNGAFQTVSIEERNEVIDVPTTGHDYVITYQVRTALPNNTGLWVGNWVVRRAGNNLIQGASIDPGTAAGAPRLASFVKSVRTAALRLGGSSLAGTTAATLPAATGTPVASTGSGIIIDKQGDIVTNAHVVAACSEPSVVDTANDRFHARVVTKDTASDLALVKADHHWPQPASFRDSNVLRLGESAAVSGFPLAGLVASSMAMTVGTVSATAGPRDDSRFFQVSAPVQPGNSGGPVLDNQGHVIGMVTSQLNGVLLPIVAGIAPQNVNFAIKGAIIGNFLESQGVDFARIGNAPELSTTDMGVLARRFTVRIECGTIAR